MTDRGEDFMRLSHPGLRQVWKGVGGGGLAASNTALLVVDMQRLMCDPELGIGRLMTKRGLGSLAERYFLAVRRAVTNTVRLVEASREAGIAIVYGQLASLTQDGRDVAELPRCRGLWAPKGSAESEILPELSPRRPDLVVSRTTASIFTPWFGDQLLRNMGVSNLVIAGVLTDWSVASTARDAGDRGYGTVLVADACASLSEADHDATLETIDLWYGRVMRTNQVVQSIQRKEDLASPVA